MEKTGLIETFDGLLLLEEGFMLERGRTVPAVRLQETRAELLGQIKTVGKSGDLDLILSVERTILQNDLERHASSKGMAASLTAALAELAAAETLVAKVRDPAAYRSTDEDHSLPKNRTGGVPRDQARQFFASHAARLLNQDKSRLDPEEKQLIDQRKANIRTAEKIYTALQRQVLGLPPQQRGKGMGDSPAL